MRRWISEPPAAWALGATSTDATSTDVTDATDATDAATTDATDQPNLGSQRNEDPRVVPERFSLDEVAATPRERPAALPVNASQFAALDLDGQL